MEVVIICVVTAALVIFGPKLFKRVKNSFRRGWQWSHSMGSKSAHSENNGIVTLPLENECAMFLNYSPETPKKSVTIRYRVGGGPFEYFHKEDKHKTVYLELLMIRKGNDWGGGKTQQNYRQYHRVGVMEDTRGQWIEKTIPIEQLQWHNVWGKKQGLSTTLESLDALGLRWYHGMIAKNPGATIDFKITVS